MSVPHLHYWHPVPAYRSVAGETVRCNCGATDARPTSLTAETNFRVVETNEWTTVAGITIWQASGRPQTVRVNTDDTPDTLTLPATCEWKVSR